MRKQPGFRLVGGILTFIDVPGANGTFPANIDDSGQIVGFFQDVNGLSHGFLWDNGIFDTIDIPRATNTYAKDFGDGCRPIGFYDFGGSPVGFCVVPEPHSFALVLLGALSLWCCVFRIREPSLLKIMCRWRRARQTPDVSTAVAILISVLMLPATVLAQGSDLSFVSPLNNQVVSGPNQVLHAVTSVPSERRRAVFELSSDGINFRELPKQAAPDLGVGSYTTSVDTTAFPVGTAFFRARFEDEMTGPIISVQVRRTPRPSCRVSRLSSLTIKLDCSASQDDNGGIVSYDVDFGDDTTAIVSTSPTLIHSYRAFGTYPVAVTVTDVINLSITMYKQLHLVQMALFQDRPMCGCAQMTVTKAGQSMLSDDRRPIDPNDPETEFEPAPLGADPVFVSYNFEVSAKLAIFSDPGKCTEGQQARRTAKLDGNVLSHKRACTAGRMPLLASCETNEDCSTLTTCRGGLLDGQLCRTPFESDRCIALGGTGCNSLGDGNCEKFPFKGEARGNDDYRSPFDGGFFFKEHAANGTSIWLDYPGADIKHGDVRGHFQYDGDFLASVTGARGSCSCHFVVVVDWDGANQRYNDATDLTVAADSVNCSLAPPPSPTNQ